MEASSSTVAPRVPGADRTATPTTAITAVGWLLVAGYALSVLLIGLGNGVLSRHEVLAAQPAREMLRDGRWVVPTIGGVPRTVKPPTMGWLIAGSMAAFRSDAEWVARLPAALAGVATALMVAWLGARYFGPAVGVVAGLLHPTMYYVQMQARLSEADMPLCAAVTAALLCFAAARVDPPVDQSRAHRRWLAVGFGLATAVALLLKMLIGPAFIALATLTWAVWSRDWRAVRFVFHPLALLTGAVVALSWPAAAAVAYPPILDAWRHETFGRFAGDVGDRGRDPLLFYAYNVPLLLLPWLPLVTGGAVHVARAGMERSPVVRFLIAWAVPGLIVLTLSAWKHKHYAIPLLPGLSVPAAVGLLAAVKAATPPRPRDWRAVAVVTGVAWVVTVAAVVFVAPRFGGYYRASAAFAGRVASHVPADAPPVRVVGLGESHVSYYLTRPWTRVDDREAVARSVTGSGDHYVIARRRALRGVDPARVAELDRADALRSSETEDDRLVLVRVRPAPGAAPTRIHQ